MYICGEKDIICTCLNFLNGIIASWSKNEVVIRSLFVFVLTGLFFSFCTSMASCLSNICENCVAVIHKVLEFSSSSSSESAQCSTKKYVIFHQNFIFIKLCFANSQSNYKFWSSKLKNNNSIKHRMIFKYIF